MRSIDEKNGLIFIVDDNPVYLNWLFSELNDKFNIQVIPFINVEECLSSLYMHPKIVLLDYFLDDTLNITGIDVLKIIKKNSPHTEVVIMSARDDRKIEKEAYANKADRYVVKNESVIAKVNDILARINA